jgi:hypothetical protein
MPRLSLQGPHGYYCESGPDGIVEHDTYMCQHGEGGHMVIQKKGTVQAWCKRCMGMVCEYHAQFGACSPQNPNREQWLEQMEARERFRRDLTGG